MCLTPYPTSSSKQPVKRRSNANKLKPFTFHIINFTEATSGPESPSSSPSHSPSPSNNSTDSIESSVPQLNNGLNISVNQQQQQSTSSSNHTSSNSSQSFTAATTINQSVTHNTTSHINNNNSNTTSSSRKTYVACTLATAAPQNALIKAQIDRYIHLPQPEAAKRLGISLSTLKRRFYETYPGQRWPHTIASSTNHNVTTANTNNNSFQYTVNRANHSPRTELHTNPIQAPNVVSMGTHVTSTVMMSSSSSTRSTSRATSEPTIATMPPVHYTTQSNNKINHYDYNYQSSPPLQQLPPLQHSTYSRASIVPPSARIEKPRKMARELLVNSMNRDEKFIDAMTMQALQNAFSSNPIR